MSAAPLTALVRRAARGPDTVSDADLLDRFVRSGDQAAFELLVWRHGAMVWGACVRILAPDRDAAEDACQAAFVALASHSRRIRDRAAVAAWLHRVAVRAALDLRAARGRTRPLSEAELAPTDPSPEPHCAAVTGEVRSVLDAGVNRLPDKLRLPFVMCELEGRSNAETAAALGCPVGTVESRLTRARQRLRSWLTARGVVPAVVTVVALPESVRAALLQASTPSVAGSAVKALAARAVPSAVSAKIRAVAAVGLVLAVSAVGFGLTAEQPKPAAPSPADAKPTAPLAERKDADALPAGAIARFGSPRLRHGSWVKDVCFSPDGKQLASVGYDNALRVWDAETGKQRFLVRRESGGFTRVAFADGGKVAVAFGHDKDDCEVWRVDAATGKVAQRVKIAARVPEPATVRFSPDGSRLAAGGTDGAQNLLLVLDTSTGKPAWQQAIPDESPGGFAFAPDGKTVAVSTNTGRVRLFDADGKPAGVFKADKARLDAVGLSPDGKMVVARNDASPSRELIAWDRATGNVLWTQQHKGGKGLAFTPDSKTIVQCESGWVACTIDAADGIPPGLGGKKGWYFEGMVETTCLGLRPDAKVVAFGNFCGTIGLFDLTTGKPVAPGADPTYEVRWMRFSADGKTLYGWAADWHAWEVATGKQTRVTNSGWNYSEPLSPDGKFTAGSVWYTGSRPAGSEDDGTRFEIRDAKTGGIVRQFPGANFRASWYDFTPDGKGILGACHDHAIRVWDSETGKELVKMTGHGGTPRYRAFSADGRVLVTATLESPPKEFSVRVWDLKSGKELAKLNPGVGVVGVALSGDGSRVAALAYTNAAGQPDARHLATVWDVASGKALARVPQGGDGGHIALSPDGRLVAVSASWKSVVRVYEVASATERFVFKHEGEVTGLAFAPDGRALAAASKEAPIYLWDVTGERTSKLPAWDVSSADRVWADLASKDTAKAFTAVRLLRANPEKALPLLKDRTKLPPPPDAKVIKKLLVDLGSEDPPAREAATTALAGYGESVRTELAAEAKRTDSAEAKRRLTELLGRLDAATPERFRLVRAAEAVEGMNAPEAKVLLESWASGSAGATLATEAKAALTRR